MFLSVPHDSTKLSICKCAKLAQHFCRPFIVLKHIGALAYFLDRLASIKVHLVFHLGFDDNSVFVKTLITFDDLASKPHRPKRILDSKTKLLHSNHIQEFKVIWMDDYIEDALKKQLPSQSIHYKTVIF